MKTKKQFFISILLVLVFLTLSVSPTFAADIQAAYAKIPDDLLAAFNEVGSNGSIDVVVWVEDNSTEEYQSIVSNIPEPVFEASTPQTASYNLQSVAETGTTLSDEERAAQIEAMQNYIMQKRQIAQAVYLEDNTAIANELAESGGEIVYISKYSPLVICNVTLSEAVDMAMSDSVLELDNENDEFTDEMSVSKAATGVAALHDLGLSASGVIIGMIESGIPDESLACFDGLENKMTCINATLSISSHASCVAAIMLEVAQEFEHLYYTDLSNFYENVEALISCGVNIINMSAGYTSYNTYDTHSKWIDHIAYNHSVHFVKSAGNVGEKGISSPGMAYNIITVGNTDDNNTVSTNDDMLNTSETLPSSYNIDGDDVAFKPDLCAPGTKILFNYANWTGTSMSAPHVAGIIAILCSQNPTLLTKQALVKSILLSSVSTDAEHRYDTQFQANGEISENYRKYGSGIVNAYNAIELIESGNYVNYSLSASEGDKIYSLGNLTAGQTVTITLTYLKRVRYASDDHTNTNGDIRESFADLDLHVFNAVGYVYGTDCTKTSNIIKSITTNSNVEKIVFTVTAPGPHLIYIDKYAGQDPYDVIFGLSWMIDDSSLQ